MSAELKVGIIGAGYWGPNLVRNFSEAPGADVAAVADLDPERLGALHKRFPAVRTTTNYRELLDDPAIGAICVVTPISTHRALAEEVSPDGLLDQVLAAVPMPQIDLGRREHAA